MYVELTLVIIVAACVAGQLNRGIYRLAWNKRSISPWSQAPVGVAPRSWLDRLPVVGWIQLRRESSVHGTGFWIRPALIELCFIVGLAALYMFEMSGGLQPIGAAAVSADILRSQFFVHGCLITLMIVATFVDLDEKTIPDEITVSGTLLAALLAAWLPEAALPTWRPTAPPIQILALRLTSPDDWQLALDGPRGFWIASLCILGWWYALLPKTLWYRSGPMKCLVYLGMSLVRRRFSPLLSAMAVVALLATWLVWREGGDAWQSLLSSWVGMAVGGIIVWLVRIVGSWALGQEAMGFGDVTLMGMIGAFLGWQPALIVFFLAPFTGVLIAVSQWVLTGRKDIAYGPFLCLAALLVLLGWPSVWQRWGLPIFSLGTFVPVVLTVSLFMLGVVLYFVRLARLAAVPRR